jgi:hypothetical protein
MQQWLPSALLSSYIISHCHKKYIYFGLHVKDVFQLMYRKTNNVTRIKVGRSECAGHVVRMSDGGTVNEIFLGKPDGRRKTGRPKLRPLKCKENDLKSMGVKT